MFVNAVLGLYVLASELFQVKDASNEGDKKNKKNVPLPCQLTVMIRMQKKKIPVQV